MSFFPFFSHWIATFFQRKFHSSKEDVTMNDEFCILFRVVSLPNYQASQGGGSILLILHELSSVQNPGWLFYIEDYTTQLYRDYNKPLQESLVTNQYNGMSRGFWTLFNFFEGAEMILQFVACSSYVSFLCGEKPHQRVSQFLNTGHQ